MDTPDLSQTDLSEQRWIPFLNDREAAHHAHAGWIHGGTRAVLMLVWFGHALEAGNGHWEWEVRLGVHKEMFDPLATLPDLIEAMAWADRAVGRLMELQGPKGV